MGQRAKRSAAAWTAAFLLCASWSGALSGVSAANSREQITAYYGSPVVDGEIDPVWDKARKVEARHASGETRASATFRALWDDHAIYVLAEVRDGSLSAESPLPYEQDSVEIFLDENHDRTKEYGPDDLQFRVNFGNVQTIDKGEAARFYTATRLADDGYIVEARIGLKKKPANGAVMGFELQVNDAEGPGRVGTLNVFDPTGGAWDDTGLFGEIRLAGKKPGQTSGPDPYDLLNLVKRALSIDDSLYKNPHVVKDAVLQAAAANLLDPSAWTQERIDEQYAALKAAIDALELTEEAANEKYFTPLPVGYLAMSDKPGTIERLSYRTANPEGGMDTKHVNVYLPHGYDASDKSTRYNVLYLMHGMGENENLLFGGPGENRSLKKILDNMIARGDIEPLIVVTPTFYGGMGDIGAFHKELLNDIIPLVETTYNTYAKSARLGDLKASRSHRAFGGFSMGSATTWNVFVHCLDYIKYYMPLSGAGWVLPGGEGDAAQTAEFLAEVVRKSGYGPRDYYIFSATGTQDFAYPGLRAQIEAMKPLSDVFIYSSDPAKGNLYFIAGEGGTHTWYWQNQFIYNILPDLFGDES
jgi:enterochelin esterase-like enzyme